MDKEELVKLSTAELTDMGICPTCLNRETNGAIYGDDTNLRIYEDEDIDCCFVAKPRAKGHMMIASKTHYHDMSEAPDWLNEKIVRFAKQFMKILCKEFGCERVYLCTMCDGKNNHYHVQLIPRYANEKRGSTNFVKERKEYEYDEEKLRKMQKAIQKYVENELAQSLLKNELLPNDSIVVSLVNDKVVVK